MSYPLCKTDGVMNNNINVSGQLELGFNGNVRVASARPRQTRIVRAQWWFNKMRAAVDNAISWRAQPAPAPEQIWFHPPHGTAGA